jgi:type IV pilus assembly protein PilP
MNKHLKNILIGFVTLFLLTSCTGDNSDLMNYIQEIKSRPGGAIEAIPKFAPLPVFKFPENDSRRSPFKPAEAKKITDEFAPDQNRPKQPLEAYPLDALKFVGILQQGSQIWGLILQPDKKVVPIKVGSYMGQNYGRVLSIKNTEVKLEESVQDSGKWGKHITTLYLDTSTDKNKAK